MIKKFFLFILLLSSCTLGISQQREDYNSVDSIMMTNKKKYTSIKKLSNFIAKNFQSDSARARAIYCWIANNIEYSFVKTKQDSRNVMRSKNAVCQGYANLFQTLSDQLNLETVTIIGHAKGSWRHLGSMGESHAWNAVKINGKWKLIDATWASGHSINNVKTFIRSYTDAYFFIDADKLILTHFPQKAEWQLLAFPLTGKEFKSLPVFHFHYLQHQITLLEPKNGFIDLQDSQPILIKIKVENTNETFAGVVISPSGDGTYISPQIEGNNLTFNVKFDSSGTRFFSIFRENNALITYRIKN